MRQSSTVESLRPVAPGQAAPHPVLSTALSTLNIQLEAELSRYRRAKAGHRVQRSTSQRQAAKPLDLIAVAASPVHPQTQPPAPAFPVTEMMLATSAAASATPEPNLQHSQIDPPDLDLTEHEIELDDYLASSEELLRSLSEEEAKVEAEQGFMRSLVTPLGVGSMVLLLLSSAMFGYVVTNPTSLTNLLADRDNTAQPAAPIAIAPNPGSTDAPQPNLANKEFKDLNLNTLGSLKPGSKARSGAATPSTPQKPSVPATSSASSPASGAAPTGVVQTGVVQTGVVQIEANAQNPQPIPAAPRSPEQPAPEPAPAQQAYSPAPEPVRDRAPAPSPQREAPPAVAPSHAEDYSYKVVAPYSGDSSLAEARRVVPDAFLTNSAGRAENQLGAHSSAADAEAQVQELRRQGIQAEVQKR